jgi:hypothetical protein
MRRTSIRVLENWQFDDVSRDTKLKHIMKSVVEPLHRYSLASSLSTQKWLWYYCKAFNKTFSRLSFDVPTAEKWNEELSSH